MRLLACSFGGIGGGAGGSEALVRARPRSVLAAAGNGPASSSGGSPPDGSPSGLSEDEQRLCSALFTRELLEMQRMEQSHNAFADIDRNLRPSYEATLEGYVHETARRSINVLDEIAERRAVVVAFAKVDGLDAAFEARRNGLGAVQLCLTTAHEVITRRGGLLRQFISDDKGVVIIFTFGLTQAAFDDNARRGLTTARDLDEALEAQGLTVNVGITAGEAFCGLVGVPKRRCEYGVMGPSVNLAARLMCMCQQKGVRILCCDQMHSEIHVRDRDRQFLFEPFDPVSVKGYTKPVTIYHPKPDTRMIDVKALLEQVQIFSMLAPREQSVFLEAMTEEAFASGTDIISEGDEGTTFYIITEGTVRVTQWQTRSGGKQEKVVLVPSCTRGDSFGEVALIRACKRTATVTATSDVVCMSLDASTFAALFGTMSEILSNKLDRDASSSAARSRSLATNTTPRRLRRSSENLGITISAAVTSEAKQTLTGVPEAGVATHPPPGHLPVGPPRLRNSSGMAIGGGAGLGGAGGAAAGPSSGSHERMPTMAPKLVARSKGREAEARHLANRVEALLATGEPSLCFVSGEPGIGKSHLLRELRRCYGERDVRVVHAEAKRFDTEPLSVWLQLLQLPRESRPRSSRWDL